MGTKANQSIQNAFVFCNTIYGFSSLLSIKKDLQQN